MNFAMTHLWSLPMWIMSLASASFLYFKYLLLVKMWSICFSLPFWRSVGRLFRRCLSVHRVECRVALQHQPMFHPVTSFASFVECVSANTCTFGSAARSQFCIEVSSSNRSVFFLQFVVCSSIVLYMFSTCWSAYPEWVKYMCWWFTTIVAVMARSLMYSVSSNTVFVFVFSCSRENVFVMRLPNF